MSADFNRYAVFVPGTCEGMVSGFDLVTLAALDPKDAIEKACKRWHGSGAVEGTYIVCLAELLTAYEVDEKRVPDIGAEVSLPDGLRETA